MSHDKSVQVSCKDLGSDCPYVAEGTPGEAEGKIMYHAVNDHASELGKMSEDEMVEMIEKIHGHLHVAA